MMVGNIDVDSYVMEIDEEGPHLDCDVCGVRIKHGENTIVVGDMRLHDECAEELAAQIARLT
jgi:hypothetical protein